MADLKREGGGLRWHVQKAHHLDEAVAKGQLIAGRNMTISFLENDDILFEALMGEFAGTAGSPLRQAVILVSPRNLMQRAENKEITSANAGLSSSTGFSDHRFVYVKHFWNLQNPMDFHYSVHELSHGITGSSLVRRSVLHKPFVQGVDANMFRIFVPTVAIKTMVNSESATISVPTNMQPNLCGSNIVFRNGSPMSNATTAGTAAKAAIRHSSLYRFPIFAIAIQEIPHKEQPIDGYYDRTKNIQITAGA